jgi:hypothetical protein
MRTRSMLFLSAVLLSACAQAVGPKAPGSSSDDFPAVGTVAGERTTTAVGASVKLLGELGYAQSSGPVSYTPSPRYRGFRVTAQPGDRVDVWVQSDDGDPVVWLLDARMAVVATNDDADATTLDAHLVVDIAAGADPAHYVVFREYAGDEATFSVTLTGGPSMKTCHVDTDCVRVAASCCAVGNNWEAVARGQEAAFAAGLGCGAYDFCPTFIVADDDTQAECNQKTHLCEAVKAADIACGGGMPNAHACPESFACVGGPVDRPGHCARECNDAQGVACDGDAVCSANPDCDAGEAGCMGVCR